MSLVLQTQNKKHPDEQSNIFIQTLVKGDNFNLKEANFLFAKAEGNYSEVVLLKEGKIEKYLKRISIKELESQLCSRHKIFKTHRSYLVNLFFVDSVSGNAQGYKLKLKEHLEIVPVSRKRIPSFEKRMQSLLG